MSRSLRSAFALIVSTWRRCARRRSTDARHASTSAAASVSAWISSRSTAGLSTRSAARRSSPRPSAALLSSPCDAQLRTARADRSAELADSSAAAAAAEADRSTA